MNPYASYGASTSIGTPGLAVRQEREIASPPTPLVAPRYAQEERATAVCNETSLRQEIAAAIIAGDDARAAELQAMLVRPALRLVK